MAGPDSRVGERTPTAMRIKLRYPDVETFIQKYAVNISRGGIFIATKTPKPIGTLLRFEFVLAQTEPGTSIIRGEGQVQWTREFDAAAPNKAHGMGVKFTKLDAESQEVVDRALAFRSAQSADEDTGERVVSSRADADAPTSALPLARARTATPPPPRARTATPPPPPRVSPPTPIFDAPTPVRTLRSDGTLAAPNESSNGERKGNGEMLAFPTRGGDLGATDAQLEELAQGWGISEERIARTLARMRDQVKVGSADDALAELEQLRSKPAAPPVGPAEALAELRRLLD